MKKVIWKALTLALFTALGFLVAIALFRVETLIDYDSGRVSKKFFVGPIRVRQETLDTGRFANIRLNNGLTGLSGKENWHTALVFFGNSKISANYEGGLVLNWIKVLENTSGMSSHVGGQKLKQSFLEEVTSGNFEAASKSVERAQETDLIRPEKE